MKFKDYFTVILSAFAFLVSVTGFYYQNLRVYHSLRTSISFDLGNWSDGGTKYTYKGYIINYGNKTEVVSKISPQFGEKYTLSSLSIGPFVLKPGEASAFEISDSMAFFISEGTYIDSSKENMNIPTRLSFDVVNYDGGVSTKNFDEGILIYHEPSDTWQISKDLNHLGEWFELTE